MFLTVVTALLGLLGFGTVYRANQPGNVRVSGHSFQTEFATTDETRQRGLSGLDSFDADAAMLFVFDRPEQRCFWMKDMKFNIDIIWLDASKRVVGLKQNAQPASYPESYCHDHTQFVVEFVAGTVEKLRLEPGSQFSW